MSVQISLTMPETLFKSVKNKTKEHGYRSVQEYMLQCARDKIFLENLPEYERILKETEKAMTKKEFLTWLNNPK